jgi:dTDP-4-dehydrorhamnose reductase
MRLLITGASGQLGGYLLMALRDAPEEVIAWSGRQSGSLLGRVFHPVDLADPTAVAAAFAEAHPHLVLHVAANARVADCFRDPDQARRVNVDGTARLCALAHQHGARVVYVSTDMVFEGEHAPYREEDIPTPLSVYGRTKAAAEQAVLAEPGNAVVRLSLLEGPSVVGKPSFYDEQVQALQQGKPLKLFADEWRTPLALADAAQALLTITRSEFTGLIHVGGPERLSRFEMGRRLAARLGLSDEHLVPTRREDLPGREPRPRDLSLDSSRYRAQFATVLASGGRQPPVPCFGKSTGG